MPVSAHALRLVRGLKWEDVTKSPMATSLREIWRDNPWWAKLLLAVAIVLFVLAAVGFVQDVGLAALNLTAIAFLFSMNRTLGELSSTLNQVDSTLDRMDSKL